MQKLLFSSLFLWHPWCTVLAKRTRDNFTRKEYHCVTSVDRRLSNLMYPNGNVVPYTISINRNLFFMFFYVSIAFVWHNPDIFIAFNQIYLMFMIWAYNMKLYASHVRKWQKKVKKKSEIRMKKKTFSSLDSFYFCKITFLAHFCPPKIALFI